MQISTHELIKLMAEVANREVGAYIEKVKEEKKNKLKHYLVVVHVNYEFYDVEKDISTYVLNQVVVNDGQNAVLSLIQDLQLRYLDIDIKLHHNPIALTYIGYKLNDDNEKVKVFEIRNIRDKIINRYEV